MMGAYLDRLRHERAARFQERLAKCGMVIPGKGVRWYDTDPTDGADPDWRKAGYYFSEGDGIALLGLTYRDAQKFVTRVRKEADRAQRDIKKAEKDARWLANAPKRQARAKAFGQGMLGLLKFVASNGAGLVKTGAAIADAAKPD